MARESSQKFVGRNRPPRVQLEYDVEIYGAEKKVQVPFVMGVMSDLSGVSGADLPAVADRKPVDIQADNFDARLKSMKPRVRYNVANKLTGEGKISCDMTFESMEDFTPAQVARKIEPLSKLLEARTELANLVTYMDGKTGAEDLIAKILNDPALLKSLASKPDAKST
jgi:type VI secretion protein, VC_A0107 family